MKLFFAAPLLVIAACTTTPTGSACPTSNRPTYASFGKTFFSSYCTDCHSANAPDRHGAPSGVNFDTEAEIRATAEDIDIDAAAGPKATNTSMPDLSGAVKTQPTQAERETLGQFLACEKAGGSQ